MRRFSKILKVFLLLIIIAGAGIFTIPYIASLTSKDTISSTLPAQFPVTVDPISKTITENNEVNAYLEGNSSPLQASAGNSGNIFSNMLQNIALLITGSSWYQSIASVGGVELVSITPGMRKEQAANAFGKAFNWDEKEKKIFLTPASGSTLPFAEGSFFPGVYAAGEGLDPYNAQALVNERFTSQVLSHYGTSTQAVIPIKEALTIASLIQRETIGTDGMRLVSGIIWNRIFSNMNLQIDSTLQYAEANTSDTSSWWPSVEPKDKFIKSPYNTYLNKGLPPAPIANPSVAAILAALNPIKTTCLYYFNDPSGKFHCSDTYAEHKKLIAEYYPN